MNNYVLITAAYNEETYIEKTIISVINQKQLPVQWIIVSDNSTDETENIVTKYLSDYKFIKLVINKRKEGRNFASKVYALNTGINNLTVQDYNFIGILDADVTFEADFYSTLISEFEKNEKLGIAGGDYYDIVKGKNVYVKPSPYSIRGATQFFRRDCFQNIGGLTPMKYGGEDALACYAARMNGWEIKNFEELVVLHLRPTGTVGGNILRARFRDGFVEYHLGYHPLFQFVKCLKRLKTKPLFIGSLLRFVGYWCAFIKKEKRNLSKELIDFIKKDQIDRVIHIL